MDPQGQLVCGGAEAQARQVLTNMKHVLEAGGASIESVIKTTILLQDMADFQAVNQVYSECKSFSFHQRPPSACDVPGGQAAGGRSRRDRGHRAQWRPRRGRGGTVSLHEGMTSRGPQDYVQNIKIPCFHLNIFTSFDLSEVFLFNTYIESRRPRTRVPTSLSPSIFRIGVYKL
ncbi:uncharacterized protein LOC125231694 isoform X2 [Leguminivora glycinivorella]|nr:uncharacterized protein LOC125231694 isoform X2 [Leguminivora glycinivorella]XP_047993184.1 uncharacterized protein LOC125231694 isoform X2 [Leguminivora glycinivorella]